MSLWVKKPTSQGLERLSAVLIYLKPWKMEAIMRRRQALKLFALAEVDYDCLFNRKLSSGFPELTQRDSFARQRGDLPKNGDRR